MEAVSDMSFEPSFNLAKTFSQPWSLEEQHQCGRQRQMGKPT